jgi:phosphoglycerate-specific signal transduction histidine kinase
VLERLSKLLADLLDDLSGGLDKQRERCEADAEALAKNRVPDLAAYSQQQKAALRVALTNKQRKLEVRAQGQLQEIAEELRDEIKGALDRAQSDESLRKVLQEGVPSALGETKEEIEAALAQLIEELRQTADNWIAAFDKDFVTLYRSLAAIGGDVPLDLRGNRSAIALQQDASAISGLAVIARADERFDDAVIGGGMAAGALWGTLAIPVPVVGTLVGGLLGAIGGALFSPSVDKRRPKYWAAAEPVIADFCRTGESAVGVALSRAGGQAVQTIDSRIDAYIKQYAALVAKLVEEQAKKEAQLRNRQRQVHSDLEELARHQRDLSTLAASIRQLHEL